MDEFSTLALRFVFKEFVLFLCILDPGAILIYRIANEITDFITRDPHIVLCHWYRIAGTHLEVGYTSGNPCPK